MDGGSKGDVQESFVFAEVMKYVYLSNLEVRIRKIRAITCVHLVDILRLHRIMSRIVELVSRIRGSSTLKHIRYVSLIRHDRDWDLWF